MIRVPIDKRVPLKPRAKYPWRDMKVGDSFLVKHVRVRCVRSMASAAAKRTGRKFSVRRDDDTGGVRVWRVK